jgi:hypothetical protein
MGLPSFRTHNEPLGCALPFHESAGLIRSRNFKEAGIGVVEKKSDPFFANPRRQVRRGKVRRIGWLIDPLLHGKIAPNVRVPELRAIARDLNLSKGLLPQPKEVRWTPNLKLED